MINKKLLYKKALKKWGELSQILVAIEEMSELQKELCKRDRCHTHITKIINISQITSEIADVEIMMEQLRFIYDIDEKVEEMKQFKLERLKKTLQKSPQDGENNE